MSNLENITRKILDEAKSQANIIHEESEKVNENIINSKSREATEEKQRMIHRATSEASLLKERTISNAELRARNEKLRAKQAVIDRVFSMAKERLKNLSEDQYTSYLKDTLKTLKLDGGELIVVPERMKSKVKGLGLQPKISDDETVDSGFIVKGEGIMLNYTFDSLVEYYRDQLETEIAQSLFKE